jgi:Ribonucleotide reductase, small chain/SCP-2 sterol transfer family
MAVTDQARTEHARELEISAPRALAHVSYRDLYARWEAGNWSATQLDFSQDASDWSERLSARQREAARWNYTLFFYGEDEVADNLSPFIDAAHDEEQKYALATQQVDEARHTIFFARFFEEVLHVDGSTGDKLRTVQPQLTWGFRQLFARLHAETARLRAEPTPTNLAASIALYHLIIEGTLAQTGQHFIVDYLTDEDLLPGFREGMENVSRDEQRHIAIGIRILSELIEEPAARRRTMALIRDVVPHALVVFVPPGEDWSLVDCFGSTREDLYLDAARSLETKLRVLGFSDDELGWMFRVPMNVPLDERALRPLTLIDANALGERVRDPDVSDEVLEIVMASVAAAAARDAVPSSGLVIQWDFEDRPPWHVLLSRSGGSAGRGVAPSPDVRVRCRARDWIDLAAARTDPLRALMQRNLRVRGNPLKIAQAARALA